MRLSVFALLLVLLVACDATERLKLIRAYEPTLTNTSPLDTTVTTVTANRDSLGRAASVLSAFYGLDSALGAGADQVICDGATGADGMPVIFSHEIDYTTMQAGDFRVLRASGRTGEILCVTLAPADDLGEHRTALLAGEYGDSQDPPVKVSITGDLLSIDNAVNFQGASVDVTPLDAGPTIVWAEAVPREQWDLGKEASPLVWGGGSGCPEGTEQVVRVTWAGGVTKPGGDEIDGVERTVYRVLVDDAQGQSRDVTPFALGDLNDGDNNHLLCLDVTDRPVSVSFPKGAVTDPNEDLNPSTSILVARRLDDGNDGDNERAYKHGRRLSSATENLLMTRIAP